LKEEALMKNDEIPTYLNLSISLDPAIEIPSENSAVFYPGGENFDLLHHCAEWTTKLIQHGKPYVKKRKIRTFGENLQGHSILLSRYLSAKVAPPVDLFTLLLRGDKRPDESDLDYKIRMDPYAIEKVARFVAMIPFREDMQLFEKMKDMPDLYCTCQEFLDLG
jgi:hypothetical protein